MPEPWSSHAETGENMSDAIPLNMGTVDRILRGFLATLLVVVPASLSWPRPWVVGLAALAGTQAAAIVIGHCVTYPWIGVSTRSRPLRGGWPGGHDARLPKNIGTADRVIRFGLGGALLGFASAYPGAPALVVLIAWLGGAIIYEAIVEY